jgi:hypothetical protein
MVELAIAFRVSRTVTNHQSRAQLVKPFVVCFALLFPCLAWADFDHGVWDDLLKRNVVLIDGGKASAVRYAALTTEHDVLRRYLASLSAVTKAAFDAWPKSERLAFLINAYNAFTVELILTEYPNIESIKDLGSLFRSPWKRSFFALFGVERNLDYVEHDLIRAEGAYEDPRIHFGIVCASIGCPALRNEAYAGDRLDEQLEDNARMFLSDRTRNRFDQKSGTLEVSKIFDWFAKDFSRGWKGYRSVAQFLAVHANQLADDPAERRLIAEQSVSIRFLDYDWKLNDAK